MDEVVVLDSGSIDRTVEKAEKMGAAVSVSEFMGYVDQKNKAMDLCHGDWMFNLDADEEVTSELRKSIEEAIFCHQQSDDMPKIYNITRKTWYMGRWIKHCGWYPEYRIRLSKRGHARWQGDILHEVLQGNGRPGFLSGDLLHRPYGDLGEHLKTIEHYSALWAKREVLAGHTSSLMDITLRPFAKFMRMYFLSFGILDRGPGFIASSMGAWYIFMKYVRLYESTRVLK